ncbi:helix-turn-helix transcriptional regulator [Saprospiraceae bacterium]|nr:helix-turn-helix transcriptional regulator [Saprospiraceae bacterium]
MTPQNYLTNRELEVLNLLSSGYSTPEISSNLFLSTETIKTYRRNLIVKLEAKNVAHLIRIAFEKDIIFSDKKLKTRSHQFKSQLEMVA